LQEADRTVDADLDTIGAEAVSKHLHAFLSEAEAGRYVSLQVWLPRTQQVEQEVQTLRFRIRDRYRVPVVADYGPEYVHGTGQQHKGDSGGGIFVQLYATPNTDVPIPDAAGSPASDMTFGSLHWAQALGDRRALEGAGRSVISLRLGSDPIQALRSLAQAED
jgi:hypothetical protein